MNLSRFIALRIYRNSEPGKQVSRPAVLIAMVGIALGLAVMIIAVSVIVGFKSEVRDKIVGFGVDDRGMFIGIVRRQAIIRYCYDRSRAAAAEQRRKPEKQEKRVPVSAGVQ